LKIIIFKAFAVAKILYSFQLINFQGSYCSLQGYDTSHSDSWDIIVSEELGFSTYALMTQQYAFAGCCFPSVVLHCIITKKITL